MGLYVLFTHYKVLPYEAYQPVVNLGDCLGIAFLNGQGERCAVGYFTRTRRPVSASPPLYRKCKHALTISGDGSLPGRLFVA